MSVQSWVESVVLFLQLSTHLFLALCLTGLLQDSGSDFGSLASLVQVGCFLIPVPPSRTSSANSRAFQPWHCWHFGLDKSLLLEAVLWTLGYFSSIPGLSSLESVAYTYSQLWPPKLFQGIQDMSPGDRITSVIFVCLVWGALASCICCFPCLFSVLLKFVDTSCAVSSASFSLSPCWSLVVLHSFAPVLDGVLWDQRKNVWLTCCLSAKINF